MPAIFNALPGIEVPVGEISKRLAEWWDVSAASGRAAPSADDAKATQVNFVLHFGLATTPEDAEQQFQTVVRFSRRYPSRIVVLCPLKDDRHSTEMRAKIYGECHLGKSKSDKRCVEFVLLSYPQSARSFLENQVSICLSTDLPMYYWAHRFSASGRLADYQYLLTRAKRVLIDSAAAPADALTYGWPKPEAVRDLAHARLLPVRQSLGQFLSGYEPAVLAAGLVTVTIAHEPALLAEARVLKRWLRSRLLACGAAESLPIEVEERVAGSSESLAVRFKYRDPGKRFSWRGDLTTRHAEFDANLGGGETRLPAAITLLAPENALSEAMFF